MAKKPVQNFAYEQDEKVVVKKGGFWGKFFAVFLGFLFGVIATVGGVGGVGYYFLKHKTVGEVLEMAKVPYDTYSVYLSDTYSEKIVWDAVGSLIDTAKGLDEDVCLRDLSEISPIVADKAYQLTQGTYNSYGIDLDMYGDFLDVPLVDFNAHLTKCIKNTPLGDMISKLGENEINKVVVALCYGTENEDYFIDEDGNYQMLDGKKSLTIADFSSSELNRRLNAMPVDVLLDVDMDDATIRTIAYGTEHRYVINSSTQEVEMQPMFFTYKDGVFFDDNGEVLEYSATPVDGVENAYILSVPQIIDNNGNVLEDSHTYYVERATDGKYYAFEPTESGGKGETVLFSKTKVGTLQHDAMSLVDKILMYDALDVTYRSHPLLVALCFGEEDVDFVYTYDENGNKNGLTKINTPRTIGEFKRHSQEIFENMYLTDVISPKRDNKLVMYLLYGKEGVHYQYNEATGKFDALQMQVALDGTNVYNEYGERIVGAVANGTSSYTLDGKTYSLTAISDGIITVNRNVGSDESPVMEKVDRQAYFVSDENGKLYYTRTQLKNLSGDDAPLLHNITGRLTLDDVIDVDETDTLLFNLKDVVIEDLAQAVKELTVLQVFGGEHGSIRYLTFEQADVVDGSYTTRNGIVYTVESDEFGTYYPYDTQKVYVGSYVDWDGKPVSGDDRILTKIWWYLLHDYNQPDSPTAVVDCPLLEFEKLADNMTHNMKIVTLNQLNADGIVETGDGVRTKKLVKEILMGDEEVYAYINPETGLPEAHPETGKLLNEDATLYPYYVAVVVNGEEVEMGEMAVPEMMHYLEVAVDEYNALLAEKNGSS